jgi:hypothetical protein
MHIKRNSFVNNILKNVRNSQVKKLEGILCHFEKNPSEFNNFLEANRESIEVEANKSIIAPSRSSCPKANN